MADETEFMFGDDLEASLDVLEEDERIRDDFTEAVNLAQTYHIVCECGKSYKTKSKYERHRTAKHGNTETAFATTTSGPGEEGQKKLVTSDTSSVLDTARDDQQSVIFHLHGGHSRAGDFDDEADSVVSSRRGSRQRGKHINRSEALGESQPPMAGLFLPSSGIYRWFLAQQSTDLSLCGGSAVSNTATPGNELERRSALSPLNGSTSDTRYQMGQVMDNGQNLVFDSRQLPRKKSLPTEHNDTATAVSNAATPGEEPERRSGLLPPNNNSSNTCSHMGQTVDDGQNLVLDSYQIPRGKKVPTEQDEIRSTEVPLNDSVLNSNSNTDTDEKLKQLIEEISLDVEKKWHEREKAMMEKRGLTRKKEIQPRQIENKSKSEEGSLTSRGRNLLQNSAGGEGRQWVCEDYQRLCLVHFPCCKRIFPCHLCHNRAGCSTGDAEAKDADYLQCTVCNNLQEINQDAHTCARCYTSFAAYFCSICKHFTGRQRNPFHCTKCGICRKDKDSSFHCDVCNICLNKRVEGTHRCRPNSGEEKCCICQEKTFNVCDVMPCTHLIHRECAVSMVQHGLNKCPICDHLFTLD